VFESVQSLLAEHEQLQQQLADPAIHADAARAKKVNRRYAELSQIAHAHAAWQQAQSDLEAARELAREDEAFAEEVPALEEGLQVSQEKLRRLLIPRDPDDGRDVIMEIKGGEGGEESALFAADLLRMYLHYAESRGWKTELLERTESDLGGYKDVQVAIKSTSSDPADGVWASLKYEGGVHRVQRVPATESQGRIHTSTTGVLVFPEVDEPEEIHIDPNDLKIDASAGEAPGGARGGRLRRAQEPDPLHGPLRAHPHLQLPREPHRRPSHRLQGVQPRPGHERRHRPRHRVLHPDG